MPKSLIEVPSVAHLNIQVPSFKMILISAPQPVPRPSFLFWEKFGRTDEGSFTVKIAVPYVAHLKVQVLIFNMNLFSSPFRGNLGDLVNGRSQKKAKIVD